MFFARSFDSRDDIDFGVGLGVHWLEVSVGKYSGGITNVAAVSIISFLRISAWASSISYSGWPLTSTTISGADALS